MGEAFLVANKTKKEYIYPHAFGDGYKLPEILYSARGALAALGVLLLAPEEKGRGLAMRAKGDPIWFARIVGRWRHDTVVITGEYNDAEGGAALNDYDTAMDSYVDISHFVRKACGSMLTHGAYRGVEEPPFVYDEATALFKPREP